MRNIMRPISQRHYAVDRILDFFPELSPEEVFWRLRECSFVSLEKRYMYFEVPKAACTQMKELLREVEKAGPLKLFADGVPETRRDMFVHARSNVPLPSLVGLDDRAQREVLESTDFLRITVVRNPYSRLFSAWKSKVALCEPSSKQVYLQVLGCLPGISNKRLVTFEEFVKYLKSMADVRTCNSHWRRQVDHVFFPALNFSRVTKVEQLQEGLRHFQKHLGLPLSLSAVAKNISLPLTSPAYTPELAEVVYSLYEPDFRTLGYARDSWPRDAGKQSAHDTWEQTFRDEIVERNLIILKLYEERERMSAELTRVGRIGLLSLVNAVATLYSAFRKIANGFGKWARRPSGS